MSPRRRDDTEQELHLTFMAMTEGPNAGISEQVYATRFLALYEDQFGSVHIALQGASRLVGRLNESVIAKLVEDGVITEDKAWEDSNIAREDPRDDE